jgi:hypothetical protein
MNIKFLTVALPCILVAVGCAPENSDGSDATTYSSCRITDSGAIFAADRARDLNQCWDGVNYEEQNKALAWCAQKTSDYMSSQYIVGHSYKYSVASTNC